MSVAPTEATPTEAAPAVVIVAAVADNGVIGDAMTMPWHLPGDLKRVKALTMGKPLIMGRKTFQSIGRPLPGRANIVLTRDPGFAVDGVTAVASFAGAMAAARAWAARQGATEIILFGGAEIYRQGLPHADRMEWTEVHARPVGDTVFPDFDRRHWDETQRRSVAADGPTPAHDFVTLVRKPRRS